MSFRSGCEKDTVLSNQLALCTSSDRSSFQVGLRVLASLPRCGYSHSVNMKDEDLATGALMEMPSSRTNDR